MLGNDPEIDLYAYTHNELDITDKEAVEKTISEMIFVDNLISDGLYLLNLQIVSFEIDVSPSKPVIYRMEKK